MPNSHKKPSPALHAKKHPTQQRGTETYELILQSAALLLAEVGIERLSTNLICQRAGITPPALYQYFPNKYAILHELGLRLMREQNARLPHWISASVLTGPLPDLEAAMAGLMLDLHQVTHNFPGGMWVMRALHAVPLLAQVRLDSHREVAGLLDQLLLKARPEVPPAPRQVFIRTAVEMFYSAVEMLFDEPDLPAAAVAQLVAHMLAAQTSQLRIIQGS